MRKPDQMPPLHIVLKKVCTKAGVSQRDLALATGLSLGSVHRWLGTGHLPLVADAVAVQGAVRGLLRQRGVRAAGRRDLFECAALVGLVPARAAQKGGAAVQAAPCSAVGQNDDLKPENEDMLAAKTQLTMAARKAFALFSNPFDGEVTCDDEMFHSTEFAYCREAAWQTTLHGRFTAIVGESGSGKTTLIGDLEARLLADRKAVKLIKPSMMASEDSDKRGKPLRTPVILSAIALELDAGRAVGGDQEQRSRAVKKMLEGSMNAGFLHVLVIEEAHSLPVATLKHLKRMHEEFRLGRKPMLGILLLGQPELKAKLDPAKYDVREVAQRCELVELLPLDADLKAYMTKRAARSERTLATLFSDSGVEAMRQRLTVRSTSRTGFGGGLGGAARGEAAVSMAYPLAVNNLATAALNRAAELGAPVVDADIVSQL